MPKVFGFKLEPHEEEVKGSSKGQENKDVLGNVEVNNEEETKQEPKKKKKNKNKHKNQESLIN